MASQVELRALLEAASGERIGRQSDASTNFMAILDRVMLKLHAETLGRSVLGCCSLT